MQRLSLAIMLVFCGSLAAQERIQLAHDPALSPDGSRIAFAWRDDLWLTGVDGGAARRLTFHPARDSRPLFSPDGRTIAFASARARGATQVFVIDAEGGEARQVTFHSEGSIPVDWYPDGRSLLVLGTRDQSGERRKAARLFRVPVQRGPERLVFDTYVSNFGACVDRAGRVLFTREGERPWRKGYRGALAAQVWLHDRGRFTRLLDGDHEYRWPRWLPDGTLLYAGQECGTFNLWRLDPDSGNRRKITDFEGDGVQYPAISRDGTKVLFRRLFDLHLLDLESGVTRRLDLTAAADGPDDPIERTQVRSASDATFTSDGKQTAFVAGGAAWVMDAELREPVRVTPGVAPVGEVCFLPGGEALFYTALEGGEWDLWVARPADPSRWWWLNQEFHHRRLTTTAGRPSRLKLSPDGRRLAYLEGRGDLWILEVKSEERNKLHGSWAALDYQWSPCGEWFAFSQPDPDGGYAVNIWLLRADGSAPAVNISRHPNRDSQPTWSPDGKKLAWVTRRVRDEADLCWVYLQLEDEREHAWDKRMEKALKDGTGPGAKRPATRPKATTRPSRSPAPIDFEKIHERVRRIPLPGGTERDPFWDPASTTLFFRAALADGDGLYSIRVEPSLGKPARARAAIGAEPVWLPRAKAFGTLVGGTPALFTPPNKVATRAFTVALEQDLRLKLPYVLDEAWLLMRDHFYDSRLNNLDWYAARKKYRQAAASCLGTRELQELINMMLGELNASHMGFTPTSRSRPVPEQAWTERTWHLGLLWDLEHRGLGLKVRAVVPRGPADRDQSRIEPGETVLRIENTPVSPTTDLTTVLNRPASRPFRLEVQGEDGKQRTVEILPITYAAARSLLFQDLLRARRARVESLSQGRLGYLLIEAMNLQSFEKFQEDLYAAGHGRQGLVIDVRDNGGGSTTDLLLTALCQPVHAFTVPRGGAEGYPRDRFVYPRWEKPIVVLCNQWSYSNAEIFAHAIQALGRGRIVGVPTAGGVISTGSASVLGLGTLRMPRRGWFLPFCGRDMERNGCVPDVLIWSEPGDETDVARDRQLEKAVEVLLDDVEAWLAQPRPQPRYASEEGRTRT